MYFFAFTPTNSHNRQQQQQIRFRKWPGSSLSAIGAKFKVDKKNNKKKSNKNVNKRDEKRRSSKRAAVSSSGAAAEVVAKGEEVGKNLS